MKTTQNLTTIPADVKAASGQPTDQTPSYKALRRQNRRLKATIRELREELAATEALGLRYMGRIVEERDRSAKLTTAIAEAKALVYRSHHHALEAFNDANSALIKLVETQCPEVSKYV